EMARVIRAIVGLDWVVREEKSVVLGRFSRPEPDITVARGPRERYRSNAPSAPDLAALVEVADSTYATDRGSKWRKYASCKISVYWMVNLPARQIEVYTEPTGRGKAAGYQSASVYRSDSEIPIILDGRELGRFRVSDVLP